MFLALRRLRFEDTKKKSCHLKCARKISGPTRDGLLARLKNENLDEEENIIIGGDFNCPLNTILDKKGGILTLRKSVVSIINSIQGDLDLIDIWRVKNSITKSYKSKFPNDTFSVWITG